MGILIDTLKKKSQPKLKNSLGRVGSEQKYYLGSAWVEKLFTPDDPKKITVKPVARNLQNVKFLSENFPAVFFAEIWKIKTTLFGVKHFLQSLLAGKM